MSRYRDTDEMAEFATRVIRAIGERVATEDAGDLRFLVKLNDEVQAAVTLAIAGIRKHGKFTDAQIAEALAGSSLLAGETKQAVQQRWPREAA